MTWAIVWGVIAGLCLLLELATTALVSIWFTVGALAALAAWALGANGIVQVAVFFGVSALVTLIFMLSRKRHDVQYDPSDTSHVPQFNIDRLVGRVVYIDEHVDNIKGTGGCKLDGQYWTCRTEDGAEISAGEKAVVTAIRGSRLIVKALD